MTESKDVYQNNAKNFNNDLYKMLFNTDEDQNILLATIPPRHDPSNDSHTNREIRKTNSKLCNLVGMFDNVYMLDVHNFDRKLFTDHGQHLNKNGKIELSKMVKTILSHLNC